MNELKIFDYGETPIRVMEIDGAPWWVAKDVCDVLGYSNSRKAVEDHVDDEDVSNVTKRDVSLNDMPNRGLIIINESGLYSLILSSKLPTAKKFKRWVTHEVLPTIRKTGGYNAKGYAPKATSVGEIVNLIRVTRETMQAQGCKPEDIAKAVKDICDQFGVKLPNCFVKPKETTLKDIDDMLAFVYMPRPKGAKQPSYEDFLAWQAMKKLGYEGEK